MRIECFLDTNVLVYGAVGKRDEPEKAAIARKLIETRTFGVSAQTLSEFYVTIVKDTLTPLSLAEIDEWIERLATFPFTDVDAGIVRAGIYIARRYRIRYYDAALLAAATRLGAPIFYSEDLHHGQLYGSVRVVNPFVEN